MRHSLPLRLCTAYIAIALAVTFIGLPQTRGQNCNPPDTLINKKGWVRGAPVPVWIDPAIQEPRRGAIEQAFNNWNGSNTSTGNGNNSKVHYTFVDTPPPEGTGYVVKDGTITPDPDGIIRAETQPFLDDEGYTIGAETTIDTRVTTYDAVLEVMSHDIGAPSRLRPLR